MNISELPLHQTAMLIGGVLLFLVAVSLLIFFSLRKRSTTPAIALLPLAILMIGFPSIKSFKGGGIEVTITQLQEKVQAVEANPKDTKARQELATAVNKLEQRVTTNTASAKAAEAIALGLDTLGESDHALNWANAAVVKEPNSETAQQLLDRVKVNNSLPQDFTRPLSQETRVDLTTAAARLGQHQKLTPEARATLAKAQFVLGQTNAAATNLQQALSARENLAVDPAFKKMLNIKVPRSPNQ